MSDGAVSNRAIAYVRVSTVRQVEEGNSIDSQSARIQRYAKDNGLSLMSGDIVIDDGISGGVPFDNRSGGSRVLDRIETGKYGHMIALNMDRMSRDQIDAVQTIDLLDEEGITVHFVDWFGSSLDTRSPMGRFVLQLVAALAEMERGQISERTRDGMSHLKENHLRFTHSIYGWDVTESGAIEPNWKEQSKIDFMAWQMERNGMSAYAVAKCMNARGWLGKKGGKWTSTSVTRVVRNDYHMTRSENGMPKKWGTRPWHRKNWRRNQRDEKIDVKPVTEVWDKGDL